MTEQKQKKGSTKARSQGAEVLHQFSRNRGAMAGLALVLIIVLIAVFADVILDYDTQVIAHHPAERLQWPSAQHWFGTDELGRDILCRILYGTRYSCSIGLVAVCIGLVVGVTLGAVAGFFGGVVEDVIMRACDILTAVPSILLAIVIVAAMGSSLLNLMIAVGVGSIPGFARITRASVLTVRNQEYVESSRAIGMSSWKIIVKHILPNCLSPIIVAATLRVAGAIIAAAGLSFIGLGIPAPAPEWGAMLSAGRRFIREYSYITFFPGLAIMITVLALNLVGDGLRDALDPKLKK